MKIVFSTILFLLITSIYGQSSVKYNRQDTLRCDSSAILFANKLSAEINSGDFLNANKTIGKWSEICFLSEIVERADIILKINSGFKTDAQIMNYFNSDLHFVYKYRMEFTENEDYWYYFEDYRTYLNYIPLRHSLDTSLRKLSMELLKKNNLTSDEILILKLFTGNKNKFQRESKKKIHKNSFIQEFNNKDKRYLSRENFGVVAYAGMYAPFTEIPIGNNPYVGLSLASPLKYTIQGELFMKFRINSNDQNFIYRAFGTDNSVNSSFAFNMGINLGVRLYENDKFTIIPKLGLGYESLNTGLSEFDEDTQETIFYNLATLHTSASVSILRPIFRRNHIGFEISYHYCPYGWDEDLVSKLENNAYSLEVFFRF